MTSDLLALFVELAEQQPDAPALVAPNETISYGALLQKTERIAASLQAKENFTGTPPLIGICLPRSTDAVCAMLGILLAGGAYLPIDPSYPAQERQGMVKSAKLSHVITDKIRAMDFSQSLFISDLAQNQAKFTKISTQPNRLFHVLYTSGSTSEPKGVCGTHGQMKARLDWFWREIALKEGDVCCQKTALHFVDASLEIFGTLLKGYPLVIAPDSHTSNAETFIQLLAKHSVTRLSLVVSQLRSLLIAAPDIGRLLPGLKLWVVSGERLTQDLVEDFHDKVPDARLVNLYGCSEVPEVCHCDVGRDGPFPGGAAAIGYPIAGTEIHIVDEDLRPVSEGEAGELLAGGLLQSDGYLGKADETAASFINNPFGGEYRLYRTGDRVRLFEGLLVHEGRADDQVKVRGHRIELSAVEAFLKRCDPTIALVKVVVQEDPHLAENRRLVAFVSPETIDTKRLKARMLISAPRPMQPQRIIALSELPTTPSGKIDRLALRAKAQSQLKNHTAPNDIETTVRRLWSTTLMNEEISLDDNFFDVGGDSLSLARLHQELLNAYSWYDLSLAELLAYPTIRAQIKYLNKSTDLVRQKTTTRVAEQDIAVIGLSCRFPGANTPEEFWENLAQGIDSVTDFTDTELEQYDQNLRYDANYVKAGAILENVSEFDAAFFGFSEKEAALLDPQHRVLLECAWEAMERAGVAPGGNVGVFAGSGANSYYLNQIAQPPVTEATLIEYNDNLSNDRNFLATRIAYKLGLTGPALTTQTACSTGLVVTHLACQALQVNECEMALAASVSIKTPQKTGYLYEEGMIRSPDGRCRAFDAAANGTLFGSGAAAVLLKPLAAALADGDPVLAVIKGSAVNNDGVAKVGYTAPSVEGQADVIKTAMTKAGFDPESIGYIEAHGTGTRLGDPIEIAALTRAYRQLGWKPDYGHQRCAIGTVKSNIGHLDETAGMAGLVKTVLALQHGAIPPSLHFKAPNPQIDFASSPFEVITHLQPWKTAPRRAGVSSFGMGGTNCHVVLEAAPDNTKLAPASVKPTQSLLVLSAPTTKGLAVSSTHYHDALLKSPNLTDFCATAATGRKHFRYRRAVMGTAVSEMAASLRRPHFPADFGTGIIAFVFSGQGAQYPGMTRGLYESCAPFRESLDKSAAVLEPLLPQPLLPLIFGDTQQLSQTIFTQPALVSVEIALMELWQSWGVKPGIVLGHSIGEYAAAYSAGVFDLEGVLQAVAARGRLMQELPSGGAMLAIALSADETSKLLGSNPDMCIAGLNSAHSTTVAGDLSHIKELATDLQNRGIRCKQLDVSHAFHSAAMEPMLTPFKEVMFAQSLSQPQIPLISNVTGDTQEDVSQASYWVHQVRAPVQFAKSVQSLVKHNVGTVIEIGPSAPLLGLIAESNDRLSLLPSLRKGHDDWGTILNSLGKLYEQGHDVDWDGFYKGQAWRKCLIPTSPFQRKRCWKEKRSSHAVSAVELVSRASKNLVERGEILPEQSGIVQLLNREIRRIEDIPETDAQFYCPVWQKVEDVPFNPVGRWLILADQSGIGIKLANRLSATGATVLVLHCGNVFQQTGNNEWTIDPLNHQDLQKFWQRFGRLSPGIDKIVDLWGINGSQSPDNTITQVLERALTITSCFDDCPPVTLVTRGAQTIESETNGISLEQATLWGLSRTRALEHSQMWGGIIDLAQNSNVDDLWRALGSQDQVAIRSGNLYAARLEPVTENHLKPIRMDSNAIYMITGGLGALGLEAAEVLADLGARHLILVSRTGGVKTDEQARRLTKLKKQGVSIETPLCDISNSDALCALFAGIKQQSLKGIIHAAGVIADAPSSSPDASRLRSVMQAKTEGAWVLHKLTEKTELDFFVLFSSASSLLGLRGHADYAAANAYLDALVAHRCALNLPALAISWGDWAGTGMAAGSGTIDTLAETGLGALSLVQARKALAGLMGAEGHWAVLNANWSEFVNNFDAHHAFLSPNLKSVVDEDERTFFAAILETSGAGQEQLLHDHILKLVSGLLGDESKIDPAENLLALGFDSLMLINLRNQIRQNTGLEIKLPYILQGPSINEITETTYALLEGALEPPEKTETQMTTLIL